MNRSAFLHTLLVAPAAALLLPRTVAAAPVLATLPRVTYISIVNSFYIRGKRPRPSEWTILSTDGRPQTQLEVEVTGGRPWHAKDGKSTQMVAIQWADETHGIFGGILYRYAGTTEGPLGHCLGQEPFVHHAPVQIVYIGSDPLFADMKART